METWFKVVVLSVGGSLGVNARFWLGVWMSRWTSPQFPWATFAINVTGSFFIGFLTIALTRWMPHPNARLLVITGFLGGYTTFSTFENDNLSLWERGEGQLMAVNLVGSVAAGFVAVLLGTVLARGLTESAGRAAAVASSNAEVIAVGLPHSVGGSHGQPISAMDRRCQATAGKPVPDNGG